MALIINASRFFEAYVYYDRNFKMYRIRLSSLRRNLNYSTMIIWVKLILTGIGEFMTVLSARGRL